MIDLYICTCGHGRQEHEEEQPYACFFFDYVSHNNCPCDGFHPAKMRRNPYDIFESLFGTFDPDKPHDPPFSVWMSEQKAKYLEKFPDERKRQIDGSFFNDSLERFFRWIDSEHP